MEVLCACDERYLPHAAAMLCSLLENNTVSKIHLFQSSIPKSERDKLEKFVGKYGSTIRFYEMKLSDFEGLPIDKWASAAVYFRLLAPRFLPADLEKVLYLDTDLIVRHPLSDLWNTNVEGHALAAAPHDADEDHMREALGLPEGTPYFNSGVLLMNLRFWNEHNVVANAISFVRNNPERIQYWDQDALNATLVGQWLSLPISWNYRNWRKESVKEPVIVHFAGDIKPWHWMDRNPFRYAYRTYRNKTPWPYKAENLPTVSQRIKHYTWMISRAVLPEPARRRLRSRLSRASA
jgi:lipopolysaccharide biosynthesis glycosyltransferase